jgi:hypothetical protein
MPSPREASRSEFSSSALPWGVGRRGGEWLRFAENTPVGPSPPASPDLLPAHEERAERQNLSVLD